MSPTFLWAYSSEFVKQPAVPQTQLPFFPDSCTLITPELAFQRRDGRVFYFNGHLPVFSHARCRATCSPEKSAHFGPQALILRAFEAICGASYCGHTVVNFG
jgi:hypothetical protein